MNDHTGIMILAEQRGGEVHPVSYELLGKGREIADKLDLKLEDVKEILSVAEKDIPLSWYEDAERFKEERVRASFRSRHSRSSAGK